VSDIRIMLADDHALLREGLRSLIEGQGGIKVVAETGDVREISGYVERSKPDILLLDLKMPGGSTIDVIHRIVKERSAVRILVLTMYDEPAFLRSALAAGASGYLLKRSAYTDLVRAITLVSQGSVFIDPHVPLDAMPESSSELERRLTQRERDVLTLIARGLSYKDVGEQLQISARTVETYRRRLADKLGLKTRTELVHFALELGLLTADEVGST
jgi:two-component system response regulator NreC